MYEHKTKPLLSKRQFFQRLLQHGAYGLLAIAFALGMGVLGYRLIGNLSWVDSILNATMILGGMGPVNNLNSDAAKLFAAAYALFSGLFFIGIAALLITPFAHRLLHRMHMEDKN